MTLTHYKSSINKLKESSVINKYDAAKLNMRLVLSSTRADTIRVIEEFLRYRHMIGL